MGSIVVSSLFVILKSIVTQAVIEKFALLAIKEVAKFTENKVDDEIVIIVEQALSKAKGK